MTRSPVTASRREPISAGLSPVPRPPKGTILAIVAVAQLMLVLDVSIVNLALPAMRDDLGFSPTGLPWVVNGYALAFGGLLLLGGRAADIFGRRRIFLGALIAFSLASLGCGLAAGAAPLIAARAIQGLAAAALSPATLSILTATFSEPGERRRALSIWTAVPIAGGAVGALLGGLLAELLSWRWIFLMNVPIGGILLALAVSALPRDETAAGAGHLDLAGAATATAGLVALVWGVIGASDTGWASRRTVGALVAAAALLATFLGIEAFVAHAPLVPLGLFRARALSAGNALIFVNFMAVVGTWYFLSLSLQRERGFSPIRAGLVFIPIALGVAGGTQIGFRLAARVAARALVAAGALMGSVGLALLGRLARDAPAIWVVTPAVIAMIGSGLLFAPITLAATSGVPRDLLGLASGLLNSAQQIGGALGLAILTSVARSGGYATGFTVSGIFLAAAAFIGPFALPRQARRDEASQ
jgi:EmrB/QacA subfamily drug resistance transporter